MKKYQLTKESTIVNGVKLFRIKKLSNGELGGFVEKEKNLSQLGNAWVFDDARVYGDARVFGDARVSGDAMAWAGTTKTIASSGKSYCKILTIEVNK